MIKQHDGYGKASGIYQIKNLVNGKFYIGQTNRFATRASHHENALKNNRHDNKHLQNAWNLHGPEAFVFSVLAVIDCEEKRTLVEQKLIDVFYGGNCYNMDRKARLSSKDFAEKISKANKGKKRKSHSEETKRKISASHTGKIVSEATKAKLRKPRPKKQQGKPFSAERKQKIREGRARYLENLPQKSYTLIDPTGKQVKVENLTVWCEENGFDKSTFYKLVKGQRKSVKGYTLFSKT